MFRLLLGLVAGIAATIAALASSSTAADSEPSDYGGPVSSSGKIELWRLLQAVLQLTREQRMFLVFVAAGESNFSLTARNTSTREAKAAGESWDRHAVHWIACGRSRIEYGWGSGGWFGMLPGVAGWNLRDAFPCLPGDAVHDPVTSIVGAIAFARGLQTKYAGWEKDPTVGQLRQGWGLPSRLGKPLPAERRARYRARLESQGLGAEFIDSTLPVFPGDYQAIAAVLRENLTPPPKVA